MNIDKFLSKGVLLTGLLAVVPVAQSAPVFINPDFGLTPLGEIITAPPTGTFTGGGWEVTNGTLYVSTGVFGFPLPQHLEFGNDAVLPAPNTAASVQQTLAGTSTAPGTTYNISFDWNRDFGSINGVQDIGNLTVTFGSTVIGSFDPFTTSPGTFSASGLLASGASTDFGLDFSSTAYDDNWGNTDRIYVTNFEITETVVPVPAAVWLFGSGLLGLIGIARRKAA